MIKQLNLEEIKKYELELLLAFKEVCEKNNLRFTFSFGTMLGAVRHKGFIPWDDDIDIMMPRPDYDRLFSDNLILDKLPEYMELYHFKNGKLGFPFVKLVDKRITIEQTYQNDEESINKLWIDIFPIDGNPEDAKELKRFYKKIKTMRKIQCLKSAKMGQGTTTIKKIIKPLLILAVKPISGRWLCEKIDREAKKYDFNESKYIGNVLWGFTPKDRISKKEYLEMIDMEFEGHIFKGPSNYHEYLRGLYGDYMKLPPVEKRVTHGFKAVYDDGE